MQIAILDDYQNIALKMADWSAIGERGQITVFSDHLAGAAQLIDRLLPFTVICIMRERTPLNRETLSGLKNLKLIVSTGRRNASLDIRACEEFGIEVAATDYLESGAPELTWALLMAITRHIPSEAQNVKEGRWQTTIGVDLKGKTMGIVGLGRIGTQIAAYAKVFGMKVIAWSENLTEERAHRAGARVQGTPV